MLAFDTVTRMLLCIKYMEVYYPCSLHIFFACSIFVNKEVEAKKKECVELFALFWIWGISKLLRLENVMYFFKRYRIYIIIFKKLCMNIILTIIDS